MHYTWNVYGITLGIVVGTDLGSLDGPFDGYNDVKLEGLLIGDSRVYNDGKVHGSDEGIKLGIYVGKVLGTIIVDLYGITLRMDVGTYLGSFN